MRLILARNKQEALPYVRPGDKYLGILPDDLFGHSDCDLMEVGNFWVRPDFKIEEIYYYCKSHNISMSQQIKIYFNGLISY
jgi:hypothetical protein